MCWVQLWPLSMSFKSKNSPTRSRSCRWRSVADVIQFSSAPPRWRHRFSSAPRRGPFSAARGSSPSRRTAWRSACPAPRLGEISRPQVSPTDPGHRSRHWWRTPLVSLPPTVPGRTWSMDWKPMKHWEKYQECIASWYLSTQAKLAISIPPTVQSSGSSPPGRSVPNSKNSVQ